MKRDLFIISLVFTLVSLAFFIFTKAKYGNLDNVYKSWDGPSYIIAAQSLYVPSAAVTYNSIHSPEIRSDFTFLPAHFPLYPLLIRSFSFLGYAQSALLISLIFSLATLIAFYLLAKELKLSSAFWLTLPLIVLPPRWFIISHIGSTEPLFIFFVLVSLLFYFRRSPWASAIAAALAMLSRPQGALLGLSYLVIAGIDLYQNQHLSSSKALRLILARYAPYLLVPLALIAVFVFYKAQTGDFWAFFKAISIFHHYSGALYPTFNFGAPNVETFWQEINAVNYVAYLAAILLLFRRRLYQLGILGFIYFLPLLFLRHSDISRYALPLLPLALIAYEELISRREVVIAAYLMSPAIMAYAVNFMTFNRAL